MSKVDGRACFQSTLGLMPNLILNLVHLQVFQLNHQNPELQNQKQVVHAIHFYVYLEAFRLIFRPRRVPAETLVPGVRPKPDFGVKNGKQGVPPNGAF